MRVDRRIGSFSLEGKAVLGFDTALDSQAFAQAKLASFISHAGHIVYPGGRVEFWKAGGVIEREGSMVIWGPPVPGERLDLLIAAGGRDEALDALRYWMAAWPSAAEEDDRPWPAGAFVAGPGEGDFPPGTVFFPPRRLVKRCVEVEGPASWLAGAERWVHPDLTGPEAAAFTAGALLYRILSGTVPFPREDGDLLRQDIREGVFLPPRLAAPGIDEGIARLISGALSPVPKGQKGQPRPALEDLGKALGPPGSRKADSWFHPLEAGEQGVLERERERFSKRRDLSVKTRRFFIRNTAIITGVLIVLLAVGLIAQSIIQARLELPTTRDMSPQEVVSAYYGAFGDMDHQLMDACVINKAGKDDISMVTNFFVISRVRQAYEMNLSGVIPAQKWLDAGSPPVTGTVFGVSDLEIGPEWGGSGEIQVQVSYRLWVPESVMEASEGLPEPPSGEPVPPRSFSYTDDLKLIVHKGAWRIAEIRRRAG